MKNLWTKWTEWTEAGEVDEVDGEEKSGFFSWGVHFVHSWAFVHSVHFVHKAQHPFWKTLLGATNAQNSFGNHQEPPGGNGLAALEACTEFWVVDALQGAFEPSQAQPGLVQ